MNAKNKLLGFALVAISSLTACSSDDEYQPIASAPQATPQQVVVDRNTPTTQQPMQVPTMQPIAPAAQAVPTGNGGYVYRHPAYDGTLRPVAPTLSNANTLVEDPYLAKYKAQRGQK